MRRLTAVARPVTGMSSPGTSGRRPAPAPHCRRPRNSSVIRSRHNSSLGSGQRRPTTPPSRAGETEHRPERRNPEARVGSDRPGPLSCPRRCERPCDRLGCSYLPSPTAPATQPLRHLQGTVGSESGRLDAGRRREIEPRPQRQLRSTPPGRTGLRTRAQQNLRSPSDRDRAGSRPTRSRDRRACRHR